MAPQELLRSRRSDYHETLPSDQPQTVIGEAVRKLRMAIMRGDLVPGQKLVEADLCRELAISRASVREALRALQADRLIELIPNRGPFVAKLDLRGVEEIHEVWALLTGKAVARFSQIATADDLAELDLTIQRLKKAVKKRAAIDQLSATNAFFGYILDRCENQVLVGFVSSLVLQVNFLRAQSLRQAGWGLRCIAEIEAIAAAIHSRQPDAARQATERHIGSACTAAKQFASDQDIGPDANAQSAHAAANI